MEIALLAATILCGAMYFPARNYDEQQPISVIGRKKK